MKTIYILLTRSGTLLSNLVYRLTGARSAYRGTLHPCVPCL